MKFLLIRAGNIIENINFNLSAPNTQPPLGLLYLGAALEQDGNNVKVFDYCMENVSKEKLKNALISSDAVGLSMISTQLKYAKTLSELIKNINPEIPLIIGGPHCTFFQKQSLNDIPQAKISLMGEGEHEIIEITRYLQGRKKLANIHGIYYRENNRIRKGKPIKVIHDLDSLFFPARNLVNNYDYGDLPFGYKLKKKVTSIITSRGCPFNCRFCSRYKNVINTWGFRKRSVQNVLKECSEINGKYRTLTIADDNFLADKKRANKIFDGLIEMGKDIELVINGVRADSYDKLLYQKMKKAGAKYLFFGLESGNQDVLDYYNKKITLQQSRDIVNLARKTGFITTGSFIFGAPIETKEHIENTIKFACSLPLDVAGFGPLWYLRGSQIWNEAVKDKKISKDTYAVFAGSEKGLGNLTKRELSYFTNYAYSRFYFRSSYIFKQIFASIRRNDYQLLIKGLKYFIWLIRNIKNQNPILLVQ